MKQEISLRELAHTKELLGVGTAVWNRFQPKFYTVLELPWTLMATPLHPREACFSLVMVYTHAVLVLHRSWLTPMQYLFSGCQFIDFIYGRMYLSTTFAGFIAGQYITDGILQKLSRIQIMQMILRFWQINRYKLDVFCIAKSWQQEAMVST